MDDVLTASILAVTKPECDDLLLRTLLNSVQIDLRDRVHQLVNLLCDHHVAPVCEDGNVDSG